jgi:nucleoside-diphosphate-sugar epimerase
MMRNSLLPILLIALQLPLCCTSFAFQLPKIQMPWEGGTTSTSSSTINKKSPIKSNDKVVIFGATGGVGQLVTKKLSARDGKNYQLTIAARDAARAKETLDNDNIDVVELNLVGDNKATDAELQAAIEGATGVVVSVGTTAFPTKRWDGGNNPKAIDMEAVTRIANAASNVESVRRMVLLTSVGVSRTNQMPFLILNLFGVLDAKRAGEDAVKSAAGEAGFSYSIVRPGRLVGGPYTNLDLANLFKIEGGAENGVDVAGGDVLLGDCKRDACAEAVVQCLENDSCVDLEFSLVSNEDTALTNDGWSSAFTSM